MTELEFLKDLGLHIQDRIQQVTSVAPTAADNTASPTPVPVPPVPVPTSNRRDVLPFSAKLNDTFLDSCLWIEDQLGLKAHNLICCMGFETGRTFSPSIKSPVSSATGLIQFMDATARRLGTTTSALAQMTAAQQLGYVYKYFKDYADRGMNLHDWNLGDTYMAILWPAGIGMPDTHVIFSGGQTYAANKGLDANHDGLVTRGECLVKIRQVEAEGMSQRRVK